MLEHLLIEGKAPREEDFQHMPLHMEGNASRWYEIYKLQHGLGSWEEFGDAVRAKFGVEEYSQAMNKLLNVHQKGTVEDYLKEFEGIPYATTVHNPELDQTMYVAHFIKGLKSELQSHLPATVDRAALLAQVQQMVLEKQRQKSLKFASNQKFSSSTSKSETRVQTPQVELSKE
jgi:hypothetical protein